MSQNDIDRYTAAAHAMQSGVMGLLEINPTLAEDKHVRVGITSNQVSDAAVARLLIEKGIFTLDEYHAALAAEMDAEVDRLEATLSEHYGRPVILA
jgi:hypothetical protein